MAKGFVRGFYRFSESYYAKAITDALAGVEANEDYVMVGLYEPGGGTKGEFRVKFNEQVNSLELQSFADGLEAVFSFSDVLKAVAAGHTIGSMNLDKLCKMMAEMGIADMTERVAPAA